MDTLYLVMPAYNEECNIKEVVESWYPVLSGKGEDSKLVVADSGSTDGTHSILEQLREKYPKLEIISDTAKEHGPKVIALYDYAIQADADYIFQTDSDGQTNPEEFEAFWNMREQYDAIFGNRGDRGDGKIRAFIERVVCFLLRLFFGVQIPDANAPFRLLRAASVKKYLNRLPVYYNLPNIMLVVYFAYYGERVKFLDIAFGKRKGGVNSLNLSNIVKIGWHALDDFSILKRKMEMEGFVNLDRRKKEMILTGSAFAFFLFIACYKLTNASLWLDESIEYWYSKVMFGILPFENSANMYERILSTYQPPLYNVLMHFWLKVSDTEWWFRFFGVMMGFIGMIGLYKSVRKLSNALFAALSVIMASVVFRLVYYWQECAEYSLMLGILCWTIYFWICLMQETDRKNIVLFTIAAAASVYSQYGAVFPVVSMAFLAFLHVAAGKNRKRIADISISYLCAAVGAAAPLYYFFLRIQMRNPKQGGGVWKTLYCRGKVPPGLCRV